jgi:hypothetical protein
MGLFLDNGNVPLRIISIGIFVRGVCGHALEVVRENVHEIRHDLIVMTGNPGCIGHIRGSKRDIWTGGSRATEPLALTSSPPPPGLFWRRFTKGLG